MAAIIEISHGAMPQLQAPKKIKMVWVRKANNDTKKPCPLPSTSASSKRVEPQEPTWRRVLAITTLQKVEPEEPPLSHKNKGKMNDVTNVPSSSTSTLFLPMSQATMRLTRPQVVTQEPTMGKTSP